MRIEISGDRGEGKTTLLLALAEYLGRLGFDVMLADDVRTAEHEAMLARALSAGLPAEAIQPGRSVKIVVRPCEG